MAEKQVWKVYHEEHEIVETVRAALKYLQEKHGLSQHEALELCSKDHHLTLPVTLFSSDLSPLEAVVRFLKEEHQLSFAEIGALLSRDDRTIWTTHSNAQKKVFLLPADTPYRIPIMLLADRRVSILEALTEFLHDISQLSMRDISLILKKHENTVRTSYARAKRKRDSASGAIKDTRGGES